MIIPAPGRRETEATEKRPPGQTDMTWRGSGQIK
jgi:hypothetical protein